MKTESEILLKENKRGDKHLIINMNNYSLKDVIKAVEKEFPGVPMHEISVKPGYRGFSDDTAWTVVIAKRGLCFYSSISNSPFIECDDSLQCTVSPSLSLEDIIVHARQVPDCDFSKVNFLWDYNGACLHIERERFYKFEDLVAIEKSQTFEELLEIAMRVLRRIEKPASMVCGPISTGGLGSLEKNMQVFEGNIKRLQSEGVDVFSQIPLEKTMWRIKGTDYFKNPHHLLETFYVPIFQSGLIKTFYFIPGWETSIGASWEHGLALNLELGIKYLKD